MKVVVALLALCILAPLAESGYGYFGGPYGHHPGFFGGARSFGLRPFSFFRPGRRSVFGFGGRRRSFFGFGDDFDDLYGDCDYDDGFFGFGFPFRRQGLYGCYD